MFTEQRFSKFGLLFVVFVGSAILLQNQALAQIEEIIVTAQKREESLQEVSVAVTVITGEDLRNKNLVEPRDLFQGIPNVAIRSNAAAGQVQLSFRGVGYGTFSPIGVQPVIIFQDEVAQSSPQTSGLFIFDTERIEVLRGPQNTLYGRNTTGGAVNFISRKPQIGGGTNGYSDLTFGDSNTLNFEGAIGGELSDNTAYRLAVQSINNDGYWDNLAIPGDTVGERNQHLFRAQLAWQAKDNISLLFNVHGGSSKGGQRPYKAHGLLDPVTGGDCTNVDLDGFNSDCVDFGGNAPNPNTDEVYSGIRNDVNDVEAFGGSVRLDWDLDGFSFLSLTSYAQNDFSLWEDDDGIEFDPVGFLLFFRQEVETKQFSQEFRFTSDSDSELRWIAGGFGFWEDVNYQTAIPIVMAFSDAGNNAQDTTLLSVFGEVEYDITDQLTVVGGLRYVNEEKKGIANAVNADFSLAPVGALDPENPDSFLFDSLSQYSSAADFGPRQGPDVFNAPFGESWDMWGGKLGIEYTTDNGSLLYATITRGEKGGQFTDSPDAVLQGGFFTPVDPEEVLAYEGGFKANWLDSTLQTNVAVFFTDYTNQQGQVGVTAPSGNLSATVVNLGDSEIFGLEIETLYAPGNGWFINLGIGLLNTEVTSDRIAEQTGGLAEIEVGRNLTNAPDFTLNLGVTKEFAIGNDNALVANVSANYSDAREFRITDTAATRNLGTDPAYTLVNAYLTYQFGSDDRYRVSAWGKNLTDELYFMFAQEFGAGAVMIIPGDPRRYGVTFGINF